VSPPRLVTATRQQIELQPFDLESLLGPDHRARVPGPSSHVERPKPMSSCAPLLPVQARV
jgi:hypothetical protein